MLHDDPGNWCATVMLASLLAFTGCPGGGTQTKVTEESGEDSAGATAASGATSTGGPSSDGALAWLRQFIMDNPTLKLRSVRYEDEPTQWSQRHRFQSRWEVEGEVPFSMLDPSSLRADPRGMTFIDTEHGRAGFVMLERPVRTSDGGEAFIGQIEWDATAGSYRAPNMLPRERATATPARSPTRQE